MEKIENELDKLKVDQIQATTIIKQLVKKHVGKDSDFPILNVEDIGRVNSLISADPESYIPKIKTILRTGGLEQISDRILHKDVYISLNYDV